MKLVRAIDKTTGSKGFVVGEEKKYGVNWVVFECFETGRKSLCLKQNMEEIKPYRPSNGMEGEYFLSVFCNKCLVGKESENGCNILIKTMVFCEKDKEYPFDWVVSDGNPECKSFKPVA